jgi:signal transduction histidine kinase
MAEAPDSWPTATVIAALGGAPWWQKPENIEVIPPAQPFKISFWQTTQFQIGMIVIGVLGILVSLGLMAQLALHRQERWLLQQERARIARDIHDDLGSRMTQLVLHGEVAQSDLPQESETRSQLQGICDEARALLASMDEILWAVNPRRDTLRDFTSYICGYAHDFFKHTTIQCLFDVDPEMSSAPLDLPLRRSLLMAIKESLTNTLKHSLATTVRIQIRWQHQKLVVVVKDDGKGFSPAIINTERNGLANMSRRLKELGGTCAITSQPGLGCRVEFSVPLSQWRRRRWDWIGKPRPFSQTMDETKHKRTTNLSPG